LNNRGFAHTTRRVRLRTLSLLAVVLACAAAGCPKKNGATDNDKPPLDSPPKFEDEPPPEQRKAVEGVKQLDELSDADKSRFEKLIDKLASPCGKSHSLRTSFNTDKECARAPFAVRYVADLLGDGATDDDVREMYGDRYKADAPKRGFKLDGDVPHVGPEDGRVVMVEFFDYGCPACAEFRNELKAVAEAYPNDVVLYYKQYPLAAHEHSKGAAQAALAAGKQGKYHEMHEALFANAPAHTRDKLDQYAKQIGLDMKKFDADYAAAEALVHADKKEGEDAEVSGTPTLFINGRIYEGPPLAKYVKMWVDEELAVNR
jgi:protein-disulfide isomerase